MNPKPTVKGENTMKKKLISGLLAIAFTLSLAGCGAATSSAAGSQAASGESAAFTGNGFDPDIDSVSYTHLTLPTNSRV